MLGFQPLKLKRKRIHRVKRNGKKKKKKHNSTVFQCGAKCNNQDHKISPIPLNTQILSNAICLIKKNESHLLLLHPFLVSWFEGIGEVKISVCLLLALLAASASTLKERSSCTALVCSCCASNSISFKNKGGERNKPPPFSDHKTEMNYNSMVVVEMGLMGFL